MTRPTHHPSGRTDHWRLPWGLARVQGESMQPDLFPGDLLLISYRARVRDRQIVVARFVDGAIVIKRAVERRRTRTGELGWWLLSVNPAVGVDSRHRGVVPDTDVFGVALGRVWPRPRRLAVARSHALRRHK